MTWLKQNIHFKFCFSSFYLLFLLTTLFFQWMVFWTEVTSQFRLVYWFDFKMMMLLEIEKHLGPSWLRRPSVGCNCYWWQKMITCNLILCTTGTPPAHLWPRWRGPDRPWRQSELRGETSWDHTGPDRERGVTGSGEVTASYHRPHAATG